MPYIHPDRRAQLEPVLEDLLRHNLDPGGLNYVVSRLLVANVTRGRMDYGIMSSYRAAVQDCADEFYRRVMAPYENAKCLSHGDVFADAIRRLPLPDTSHLNPGGTD